MVIKCFGQEISCRRAVKGADFIKGYDEGGNCIFEAAPIADFSDYILEGGEWREPEMTEGERIEELENIVAMLLYGGAEGGRGE